jgi:ribulose-5-phosphate 4-epimerase/fuculose-1-phosphate aldolase
MDPADRDSRHEVSLACHVLGSAGLGDMVWGHVSKRDPDGRGFWMKASGFGFEEVASAEVLLVGFDGQTVEGTGRRHVEYPIHSQVFAARPDVGAVVHAHPRFSLAFMATFEPLRPISHEATLLVPPDVARFTETGRLISTADLGDRIAAALGERNALFLHRHGIITAGQDVAEAVMTAVLLERACELQLLAMATGPIRSWSDDSEALAKRDECWGREQIGDGWRYLVRSSMTGSPEVVFK